jgi:hypothetical protein
MEHGARTLRVGTAFALAAAAVLSAACENGEPTRPDGPAFAANPAAGQTPLMKQVRQATARYSSVTQAMKAGYVLASDCVEVPGLGAMGTHWVNQGLVDAAFDATAPEALLYLPVGDGYRLLGVEYIVIDAGQPAPTFESQAFDVGGTPVPVPHWSLHLWLYENNPNGTFTPFNPDVICPAES